MSDDARPKSAGDKLSAAEINRDLPVQINAGETISVASNPQAVYLKAADGEVYKTDANFHDERVLNFIGFAVTNGADGSPCTVQTKGIVAGFSGLTIGAKYYLSGTPGAISTTPGAYGKLVGIAVSATQLFILNCISPQFDAIDFFASETLRQSNDAEKKITSGDSNDTWIKKKEIKVTAGTLTNCRIKFDMKLGNASGPTGYAKIYKNGVAIGTEQSILSTAYATKSEDFTIDFTVDDLIQIYLKISDVTYEVYVKNFRIYYDYGPTKIDGLDLKTPTNIAIATASIATMTFTNQDP